MYAILNYIIYAWNVFFMSYNNICAIPIFVKGFYSSGQEERG